MKSLFSATVLGAAISIGLLTLPSPTIAEEPIPILESGRDNFGWKFDNGREFAGAKGGINIDQDVTHGSNPSLKLTGDFTEGGAYVRAAGTFTAGDITEISFWLKNPKLNNLTVRLIDSTKQCHQFKLKVEPSTEWQQVVFKPQQYFAKTGAMDGNKVIAYQSWGGSADKEWHGSAGTIDILIGKPPAEAGDSKISEIWIADAMIVPKS
jgi:hypothetical protein